MASSGMTLSFEFCDLEQITEAENNIEVTGSSRALTEIVGVEHTAW